jgi:hypothetical protein
MIFVMKNFPTSKNAKIEERKLKKGIKIMQIFEVCKFKFVSHA